MKTISRATWIIRLIGTVLLCLSLILTTYAAILSAADWTTFSAKLTECGVDAGLGSRIGFTSRYYRALAHAIMDDNTGSAARAAGIQPIFDPYAALCEEAIAQQNDARVEETYAYYLNEFDYAAFTASYDQREDNADQLAIADIYEYLDSLTVQPKPIGKVVIKVGSGQSEAFFPGFYESLAAEHGADVVGEYRVFLETVERMLVEYTKENSVTSASAYMESVFTFDDYLLCLHSEQEEELAEQSNSYLKQFAALSVRFTAEGPDREALVAFFESEFDRVLSQYPQATYTSFVLTARAQIDLGVAFDGSYKTLISAMSSADAAADANSYTAFQKTFAKDLVAEADKRAGIPPVVALWVASAYRLYTWGIGVFLVVLSTVLKKTLSANLMRKQKFDRAPEDPDVLLRVEHLKQYFKSGDYVNKAVDDVSFSIRKGEVFGLVGESGCGKTTTGRTIINLYDPTDGDVYFQGLRISTTMNGLPVLQYQERTELKAKRKALEAEKAAQIKENPARAKEISARCAAQIAEAEQAYARKAEQNQRHAYESAEEKRRSQQMYREQRKANLTEEYEREVATLSGEQAAERKRRYQTEMEMVARDNIMTRMQMIFQDPIASINPRMTVREIIAEGLYIRGVKDKQYIDRKVQEMLELVGLVPEHADRYPHEFSGGQRQRIGIARAIVLEPDLIIADEPISALDVSIQAQVINLLNELREKMGLTILFIAHNLSVVKYFSDRIAVMYFGRIVEMATSEELFEHPLHPYTKSLLSAIPYPDPYYEKTRKRIEYNPTLAHDYSVDKPGMREIVPGHFIDCNEAEFARYREELGL